MFKCGTIQISNHLHTVEHVVQSKSEKQKQKKKHIFLCVGGGGGWGATALMDLNVLRYLFGHKMGIFHSKTIPKI